MSFRTLRLIPFVDKIISARVPDMVFKGSKDFVIHWVKVFEACVEATFQLSLQIYIFLAGQWPGKYYNISSNYICVKLCETGLSCCIHRISYLQQQYRSFR